MPPATAEVPATSPAQTTGAAATTTTQTERITLAAGERIARNIVGGAAETAASPAPSAATTTAAATISGHEDQEPQHVREVREVDRSERHGRYSLISHLCITNIEKERTIVVFRDCVPSSLPSVQAVASRVTNLTTILNRYFFTFQVSLGSLCAASLFPGRENTA